MKTVKASPLQCRHLVSLSLAQNISELIKRRADKRGLLPQIRGQVTVSVANSDEGGLEGVLEGLGGASGRGVDILNTSKL
jgi:hypothetical protein